MLNLDSSLADLVNTRPAAARVLHRRGLDFCCGGKESLAEACAHKGVDPLSVVDEIAREESQDDDESRQWRDEPLGNLIEHIVARYHAPLRRDLPDLVSLARRVESVHAAKPGCPRGLADHLRQVQLAVEAHLDKEEKILFPLIRADRRPRPSMPFQVMLQEHEDHARNLRRTRELTGDLTCPADACASWRELYRALEHLEFDLMRHVHLENSVLFPRALAE